MAGPWEQYQATPAPEQGPWTQYAPANSPAPEAQRGVMDQLLGTTGPRYQLWPEKMARSVGSSVLSAVTLPGDAMAGRVDPLSQEGIERAFDLATLGSPVNAAVRAGDRAVPGVIKALTAEKAKVPTTEALKESGGTAIQEAKTSGLDIKPSAVADYSRKVQQELFDNGIHPVDAPSTYLKLKELENVPADAVFTAANLQSFRESLGATAQNFNPAAAKDQLASSRAIKQFDQLLPSLDPKDILAGTPAATQKLFERGRGDYAAAMRSNDLTGTLDRANTGILEKAEVRAQAANSGRNLDNTIRSKVAAALEKPKEVSGFSDPELAALNSVISGGPARNTSRYIGNLLGGGGGMGQAIMGGGGAAGGFALGGPMGAAIGAVVPAGVGAVSKSIANALAKRSLRKTDELVRKRSPLYRDAVENPTMSVTNPEKRAAIIRALMLNQQQH